MALLLGVCIIAAEDEISVPSTQSYPISVFCNYLFKTKQNWAFTYSLLKFLGHYTWPGTHDPSSSAF